MALVPLMVITALIAAELRGLGAILKGQAMDIFARPALTFAVIGGLLLVGVDIGAQDALWVLVAVTFLAALVSLFSDRPCRPPSYAGFAGGCPKQLAFGCVTACRGGRAETIRRLLWHGADGMADIRH